MFVKSTPFIALFILFFASGSSAAECDFNILEFLKREVAAGRVQGSPGIVDFDAIARRIENGELKMKRISGQSVSKVEGLPPGQDVFVRSDFSQNLGMDKGLYSVGIDVTTRQKRDVQFYRLSHYLGFDSVPETKLMTLQGKEVSMQVRVYGKEFKTEREYERYIKSRIMSGQLHYMSYKQDLENLAILDLVGGNMDRNISNFIFDETANRLIGIDHADSMPELERVPSVMWFWNFNGVVVDEKMNPGSFKKIMSLDAEKLGKQIENDGLLRKEAIYRMKGRIKFMKRYLLEHPDASMKELGDAMEERMLDF